MPVFVEVSQRHSPCKAAVRSGDFESGSLSMHVLVMHSVHQCQPNERNTL